MKIPPPTICSYRSMARQKARGHQSAMQPSEGCGVKRLDKENVQGRPRVYRHSDQTSVGNERRILPSF